MFNNRTIKQAQHRQTSRINTSGLELLSEVAGQLLSSADPVQWLAELFPRLAECLSLDAYCHYQLEQGADTLVLQAHAGIRPDVVPSIARLELADMLSTAPDQDLPADDPARPLLARTLDARAYFCYPLLVDHDIYGALAFSSTRRDDFVSGEIHLLRTICHQTAAAVERKRLKAEPVTPAADRAALDNERRRLQAVLDVLPVGVFIADQNGRVTAVNTSASNIWGRLPVQSPTLEQFADYYKAYSPRTGKPVAFRERGLYRAATKGERVCNDEFEIVRPDGRRTILNHAVPIRDAGGALMGGVTVAVDVTDFKRTQRQLLELNDALEQRVKDRTLSLVNHQEQLRAMASELTVTEQRERRRLAAELHDYLAQLLVASKMKSKLISQVVDTDAARSAMEELRDLIDEALKYTRTLIADLSPTILYEAGLYAAIQWLAEQMNRHGLSVSIEQQGDPVELPDDQAVIVFQTVRELLFNVAKHAGVTEAIVRLQHVPSRELAVAVEDHGSGFDGNFAPAEGKFGLFSVRERLVALGAGFELRSSPNRGTLATVRVPLQPAEAPPELIPPVVLPPSDMLERSSRLGKHVRVLLVDDHTMVREGFRNLIECDPQLEVIGEAADGEQAVELARLLTPDVIVMDINMPKMNGIEATRRIKSEMPHTAIIGLSVHDDRSLTASMIEAGASSYLTKGGDSEELARAIHQAHGNCLSQVL